MALITELMGSLEKYQLWLCTIIFLNKFGVAFHQMAIIFLAPPVHYVCPGTNSTCCDDPIYNSTVFTRTIVTEWNLICKRSWLKDLNQTIFQFGVLSGSLLCGIASDRFGRRKTLIWCVVTEVFTGLITSFLPTYWSFTLFRMLLGFSVGGIMVVGFVTVMEFVGYEYRDVVSVLFHVPFTAGYILLALFGYLIRDYVYFQLGISLSNVFLLVYICILPESPRWLLAVGRTMDAVALLESIAKINGLPVDVVQDKVNIYQLQNVVHRDRRTTTWDLFRTPNIRKNIILMSLVWLATNYYFYGVCQYICHLTEDVYINVVATGGVCLCSCIIAIPVVRYLRRKTVVTLSLLACSICLLSITFLPGNVAVIVGCIGLLFSFIVIIAEYLYCSEMFPTVVRNAAVGISSMMGRLGSMLAPFVLISQQYGEWCAPLAFGILPLIAAVLCQWLPETKGVDLMTTIEEGETLGKNRVVMAQTEATTSSGGVT